MKKLLFFIAVLSFPFISNAQDISLANNYKTKKEKRLERFKPHKSRDLMVNAGFSSVSRGMGLLYNFGGEYMITDKLGIRGTLSSNNLSGGLRSWGYHRYGVDLTYHFIQNKRWDVYAFAGVGVERLKFGLSQHPQEVFRASSFSINAGVGVKYKVTPSFGIQAEIGRMSNLGIYKKIGLRKK